MSIGYLYVNDDLQQYFTTGLFNQSCRQAYIGSGYAARVFCLLLLPGGSWSGNRCRVISDCNDEYEDRILGVYDDISVEAEALFIESEDVEPLMEDLQVGSITFSSLCAYALILGNRSAQNLLDREFGAGQWQKRYAAYQKRTTDSWSEGVCLAQQRNIQLCRGG